MTTVKINDLLGNLIASPPMVYNKLQETLKNPDHAFDDIEKIINVDPGLTARLLRIVNSPFYGLSSRVDSISHAVNILGTEPLMDLVLATGVIDKFKGIPRDLVEMNSFWKHSIACGLVAKAISKIKGVNKPEQFYIAGMLHEIGSLVIYQEIPAKARECISQSNYKGEHLYLIETDLMGFNHADVGMELLKEWNLPDRTVEGVGFHHNPMQAKRHPRFSGIVHVADILVYELKIGNSGEPFVPPLGLKVLDHLDMERAQLESLKEAVIVELDTIVQMFT